MSIVKRKHKTKNGAVIAEILLSNPSSLNALNDIMVHDLYSTIMEWQADTDIVAILIRGDNHRHFCAGGDIRLGYTHAKNQAWAKIISLLCGEYRLNDALHKCTKPLIAWATGAVMGGGMGLFQACHIRIASETVKMAMPEVYIGFFPDVGAAYFLRHFCPPTIGYYLGFSGATINAADAKAINLADAITSTNAYQTLLTALIDAPWQATKGDLTMIKQTIKSIEKEDVINLETPLLDAQETIDKHCRYDDYSADEIFTRLANDASLASLHPRLKMASPSSLVFWHQRWQQTKNYSLSQVLNADMQDSAALVKDSRNDFLEGVRALLIDKDNSPQWHFKNCLDVSGDFPQEVKDTAVLNLLKNFSLR